MGDRVNFADPTFEPSDDDLMRLSREAFAGVEPAHRRALDRLRLEIERERKRVVARLQQIPT